MYHLPSLIKTCLFITCVAAVGLSGCSHSAELLRADFSDKDVNVDYSVIYYIHADADYLFHDSEGQPFYANNHVLEAALDVAKQAHSGEVFIFYQRPEKKTLGLFPRKSSQFYHLINGEPATRVKYRHSVKDEAFLTTEVQLYNQYRNRSPDDNQQNFLLYYGHEIPDGEGNHYHRTQPEILVNISAFANGIQQFLLTDSQKFNLIVLSTCNNGTPEMAMNLMPFTDYLLASPQNLHLSHIDSKSLDLLEPGTDASPLQLARSMADQTYDRLTADIQTAITLAIYDLESVRPYTDDLYMLTEEQDSSGLSNPFLDNVDCSQFPLFDSEAFTRGVETWYHPARFGRQTTATSHSGWGCKQLSVN